MDTTIIDCIIAVIGIVLFNYKNPQKDLLVPLSVFLFLLFILHAFLSVGWNVFKWPFVGIAVAWPIVSVAFIILYALRFRRKGAIKFLDCVKWFAVFLLVLYPATSLRLEGAVNIVSIVIAHLTLPLLGVIFVYDRWILKPNEMKRKFVIVLTVQTVLIFLLFLYSLVQKIRADNQTLLSIQKTIEAQRAAEMLNECRDKQ